MAFTQKVNVVGTLKTQGADKAAGDFNRVGKAAGRLDRQVGKLAEASLPKLAGAFTALVVARRAANAMRDLLQPAIQMEEAMTTLRVVTSASEADMVKFGDAARAAAQKSIFGPLKATEALAALARATGDAGASVKILDHALGLAQISMGKLAPEEAAVQIGNMSKAFGLLGKDALKARDYVDQFVNAARTAGVPLKNVVGVLDRLGTAATAGQQSFKDATALFLIAARSEKDVKRTATGMANLFREMSRGNVEGLFARLNVDIRDATGAMRPALDIFRDLFTEFKRNRQNTLDALGAKGGVRRRSARIILNILRQLDVGFRDMHGNALQGADAINKVASAMEQGFAGRTAREATEVMNTLGGQMRRLNEEWFNFRQAVGTGLGQALNPVVAGLRGVLTALSGIARSKAAQLLLKPMLMVTGFVALRFAAKAALAGLIKIIIAVRHFTAATLAAEVGSIRLSKTMKSLFLMPVGTLGRGLVRGLRLMITEPLAALTVFGDKLSKGFAGLSKGARTALKLVGWGGLLGMITLAVSETLRWANEFDRIGELIANDLVTGLREAEKVIGRVVDKADKGLLRNIAAALGGDFEGLGLLASGLKGKAGANRDMLRQQLAIQDLLEKKKRRHAEANAKMHAEYIGRALMVGDEAFSKEVGRLEKLFGAEVPNVDIDKLKAAGAFYGKLADTARAGGGVVPIAGVKGKQAGQVIGRLGVRATEEPNYSRTQGAIDFMVKALEQGRQTGKVGATGAQITEQLSNAIVGARMGSIGGKGKGYEDVKSNAEALLAMLGPEQRALAIQGIRERSGVTLAGGNAALTKSSGRVLASGKTAAETQEQVKVALADQDKETWRLIEGHLKEIKKAVKQAGPSENARAFTAALRTALGGGLFGLRGLNPGFETTE